MKNNHVIPMNLEAVNIAKQNYVERHVQHDSSSLSEEGKRYKYQNQASREWGFFSEAWDGQANEDITKTDIKMLKERYQVDDDDYDFFYSLSNKAKLIITQQAIKQDIRDFLKSYYGLKKVPDGSKNVKRSEDNDK